MISPTRCLGQDLRAEGFGRAARRRLLTPAGAALREAPGAEGAVDLTHVVVQQHVRGARRAHAEDRSR